VFVACRRRGSQVRLEVRDSGIGIPGDELGNSFQGFSPPGRGLAVQRRSGRPIDHGRPLIKTSVR
jgi:signal transduction histidine kinase